VDAMLHYDTKPKFLAGALIGVVNQRLLRALCPKCRRPLRTVDLDIGNRIRSTLGESSPTLYEAVGCNDCFDVGFATLTCIPEVMQVTEKLACAIGHGASAAELESLAISDGMLCLAEIAIARVLRGDTTAYEANRVVADPTLATLAAMAK
jgi:type II secretory ATPase GspE/PulE/Tfp pilus assembly ATPase PilB-like protein